PAGGVATNALGTGNSGAFGIVAGQTASVGGAIDTSNLLPGGSGGVAAIRGLGLATVGGGINTGTSLINGGSGGTIFVGAGVDTQATETLTINGSLNANGYKAGGYVGVVSHG